MGASPVPEGYHTVTSYLVVEDAVRALAFYAEAFGAKELYRLPMRGADGKERIGHAETRIGDTNLMLSDEWPDMGYLGPNKRGGSTVGFVIYGPDCDATFARAVRAGASVEKAVADLGGADEIVEAGRPDRGLSVRPMRDQRVGACCTSSL